MSQDFQPGDFLVFQLESGFALLRLLEIDKGDDGNVWHLAGYQDFYPDIEAIDIAMDNSTPAVSSPHLALNDRAFQSTQVARMRNVPLTPDEREPLERWRADPERKVSDRSVRLLLGLR